MQLVDRIWLTILALAVGFPALARSQSGVAFERGDGSLQIKIDGQPLGAYVWNDPVVLRPYFAHLRTPGGAQVTRNHPPVEGRDATDHAAMHPGLWLAFGDLSGIDFWRNKAAVRQVAFVKDPHTIAGSGEFSVRNRYVTGDKVLCEEVCGIQISKTAGGYLINWDSEFRGPEKLVFGDQEEMGLGVRVATPLTVKNGGQIVNSNGSKNERQVWGQQANWCDYSGTIDGQPLGIALFAGPDNFRRSWFHARDYGVLVANPFGQKAFTKGERSRIVVPTGQSLRLRFGILIHAGAVDLAAAYKQWCDGP